jgi:hypothetical protein
LDPSSNFKNYRRAVASLSDTDACIPFFSLLVKDIYFINEASQKKLPNNHLNFERLWIVSECLSSFMMHKQNVATVKTMYAAVPIVQSVLTTSSVCTELELFRCSVENEPPDKKDAGKTMGRLRKMSSSNLEFSSDGEGTPRTSPSGKESPDAAL